MARLERKQRKSTANEQSTHQNRTSPSESSSPFETLQAKTEAQAHLLMALEKYDQVLVYGSVGTGKTFCTTTFAAQEYIKGHYDRIVITRPNKEIESSLGFFPGSLNEKLGVWLLRLLVYLNKLRWRGL